MKRIPLWTQGIAVCATLLISQNVLAETLQGALQETLQSNPDIQAVVKNRNSITQALRGAKGDYLPTLDATANAGRQHNDIPTLGSPVTTTTTLYNRQAGLTANENIFNGFATQNEVNRNKARLNSANYKIAGTAQDVALNATEAYLNVLKEQQLVSLAQQNLSAHEGVVGLIRKRSEGGLGEDADLFQSRGRLALARANLSAEQGNLADAKALYFQIVGAPANGLLMPAAPARRFLPATENQAIQLALANHPTLKSAKEDMAAAYAQHQAAASKYFPRFDFQLSAVRGQDINGIEGQNNQETAQVLMNYNLFHGGSDHARRQETAYLYQESAEVMHKTYRQVIENVQVSWNAWNTVKAELPYLQQHKTEALQTRGAYEQQFKLSKRTLLDTLDAQNEYYDASRAYTTAKFDALFDKYRVLNSIGTLLPSVNVSLPA